MKPYLFRILTFTLVMLMVSSCLIPASKERYLANFERFVNNVEKNSKEFKRKDWRWADKRYRLYSDNWYEKFREELTLREQLQIAGLKIRYKALKEGSRMRRIVDEKLAEDLEKLGEDMGKYFDENLERDVDKLTKGAREIGDSAVKVVEDLLKEIRKKKE
jgi:dipeptidase